MNGMLEGPWPEKAGEGGLCHLTWTTQAHRAISKVVYNDQQSMEEENKEEDSDCEETQDSEASQENDMEDDDNTTDSCLDNIFRTHSP